MPGKGEQLDNSFKAVAVIESLVWPLITSQTCIKCVDDEGETRFIRNAVALLNQLDIEHPIGQYVVSICNGFLKQYTTGGDTLLFFLCQWTKAASLLCEMGVPRTAIIQLLREVVDDCVNHAEIHKIEISHMTSKPICLEDDCCNLDKKKLDSSEVFVNRLQEHRVKDIHTLSNCSQNYSHHGFHITKLVEGSVERKAEEYVDDEFIEVCLTQGNRMKHTENDIDDSTKKNKSAVEVAQMQAKVLETTVDNLPVINLKMNIMKDTAVDEDDDFSWFFTDDKVLEKSERSLSDKHREKPETFQLHKTECFDIYDERIANTQSKGIEKVLNNSSIVQDKMTEDQTNTIVQKVIEDLDADLIRDINDLRKNIETDLEILKNRQRRNGTTRKIQLVHETMSLQIVEKDEFEGSWEVTEGFRWNRDKGSLDDNESNILEEDDKFINIEFTFEKDKTEHEIMCMKGEKPSDGCSLHTKSRNVESSHFGTRDVKAVIKQGEAKTDDLKTIDKLIKSIGNQPNPVSVSKQILNSSRHFRTFQSVLQQPEDSLSTGNSQNKAKQNYTAPALYDGLSIQTADQTAQTTCIDTYKTMNQSFRSLHYQEERSEDQSPASQLEVLKTNQIKKSLPSAASNSAMPSISVSGVNKLLNNLTLSVTHPPFYTTGMKTGDLEFDLKQNKSIFPENNQSVGKNVNSAVSVRSRHLNKDFKQKAENSNEGSDGGFSPKEVGNKSYEIVDVELSENPLLSLRSTKCPRDVPRKIAETIFETQNHSMTVEQVNSVSNAVCDSNLDDVQHAKGGSDNEMIINSTDAKSFLSHATIQNIREKLDSISFQEILEGLLYTNDECIVKIICDLVSRLKIQCNLSMLDRLVYSYPICGPKTDPRLVQGLIIKTSTDFVTSLLKLDGKACRVLLVNGDISARYRHKGYKSASTSTNYTLERFCNYSSKSDIWTQQVTSVLQELSVDIILARGRIHEEMISVCGYLNIVPIETVPYPQLKLLSDITETDMATYVKLATEDNICTGIKVGQLDGDLANKNVFNTDKGFEIVLTLENNNPQTVVLSEMTTALVDLKEQEFLDCLHQVTSCLKSGSILPGNAQTEILCIEHLQKNKDSFFQTYGKCTVPYKDYFLIVYEKIEESFLRYADNFHHSGFAKNPDCVFEDYNSKIAAWRVACNTVCTILNVEYYVVTGIISGNKTGNRGNIHVL